MSASGFATIACLYICLTIFLSHIKMWVKSMMQTLKKYLHTTSILLFILALSTSVYAVNVDVSAGNEKWVISETLVGGHFVYSNDKDIIYDDGSVAAWYRGVGIGTARYPGGTIVKFWDWENPTGVNTGDPWNPNWNPANNAPESEWMSLDEYLTFVDQSGIRPMFGVNSLSGKKHNRQQDSIDRAARMVQYVKDRGYGGALWYIGNEEESEQGGIAKYAKTFAAHAKAMKAVDPNILIFWNNNGANRSSIQRFLANDEGTADGLETHGKWPYGGSPNLPPGTFEEWLEEVPVRDRKNANRAWRFAANTYRKAAKDAGRPGLLIANNEYGLGKASNLVGFDRYSRGLVLTDVLQEHVLGNWFSTAFWSNVLSSDLGGLLSPAQNFRKNPVHLGMGLIASAQGSMLVESETDFAQVHGFSAKTQKKVQVFLINKSLDPQPINISIDGVYLKPSLKYHNPYLDRICNKLPAEPKSWWHRWLQSRCDDRKADAVTMVDTEDGFGEYVTTDVTYDKAGDTFTATLPAQSYTRIEFPRLRFPTREPWHVEDLTAEVGNEKVSLSWSHRASHKFKEYRVYRGNNPNAPLDLIASNLTEPAYIDTDLVNGANYIYEVRAVNKFDKESLGVEINAVPQATNFFVAAFTNSVKENDTTAANLNAGTLLGTWENVPPAGVDVLGKAGNNAMLIDLVNGGFSIDGVLPESVSAEDNLQVAFRVALRRTGPDHAKDTTITGLDESDNALFGIVLGTSNTNGDNKRVYYVDPVNGAMAIPESKDNDLQFMNDTFAPEKLREIELDFTGEGYTVNFNGGAWKSSSLPFAGSANALKKIRVSGSDVAGVWVDAVFVRN